MSFNVNSKPKLDPLHKMAAAFKADGKITPQEVRSFAQNCIKEILGRPANDGDIKWLMDKVMNSNDPNGYSKDISKYIGDVVAYKARGGK